MEGTKRARSTEACLEDRMIAETVCSAVSVAGLGIAAVTAYRKRFLAATRIAAYSLVPIGLVMTGAVEWLADTAFSPTAWAGFGRARRLPGCCSRRPAPWSAAGAAPARSAGRRKGPRSATPSHPPAAAPSLGAEPARPHPGAAHRGQAWRGRQRGRLQRHRGHPEEARHLTTRAAQHGDHGEKFTLSQCGRGTTGRLEGRVPGASARREVSRRSPRLRTYLATLRQNGGHLSRNPANSCAFRSC